MNQKVSLAIVGAILWAAPSAILVRANREQSAQLSSSEEKAARLALYCGFKRFELQFMVESLGKSGELSDSGQFDFAQLFRDRFITVIPCSTTRPDYDAARACFGEHDPACMQRLVADLLGGFEAEP